MIGRKSGAVIVFLLLSFQIFGNEQDTIMPSLLGTKWRIGFTPTAIINTYSGIQFSGEYEMLNRLSFGTEAAYIFYDLNTNNTNLQGFRVRPQVKFKFVKRKKFETSISIVYNYRFSSINIEVDIPKANGSYVETIKGRRIGHYRGFGLMIEQGFIFDQLGGNIGFGFGPGSIRFKDTNMETESFQADNYRFWFNRRNNDNSFVVPLGIIHINIFLH
jgi:hypothetical protein